MTGIVTRAEAHLTVQFLASTFGNLRGEELSKAVINRCEEIELWLPWSADEFEEVFTLVDHVAVAQV